MYYAFLFKYTISVGIGVKVIHILRFLLSLSVKNDPL